MSGKKRQNGYIALLLAGGALVTGYSMQQSWLTLNTEEFFSPNGLIDWSIMFLLFVFCRALPVYIAEDKTIDVSFVPVVASVMIYGLYPTIVLFFLSSFLLFDFDKDSNSYYLLLTRSPKKQLFNLANILLSIMAGGFLLLPLGGYGPDFSFPFSMFPATIFAVATILVNLILFILYFTSTGEEHFVPMLSQTIAGILPNVACTIPFGILIALLLDQENGSYYALLFLLPVLLARYSFKLYLDSRSMHMKTIGALSRAIEAKDHYTQGHSQRVAFLSEQLAVAMKLPAKAVSDIKIAALLHDIGKIGVEDRILNKPGMLTTDEFEEIKKHPAVGKEIIEHIGFSRMVSDAILYHHCYFDGSGYPHEDGKGMEYPLSAAILGIADAYDAMTSDRPYRKKASDETAMRVLQENAGKQFDPRVVTVFCELLQAQFDRKAEEEKLASEALGKTLGQGGIHDHLA